LTAVREKRKLLNRVSRIGGHLIAGVRSAVDGLLAEVVEERIRTHLLQVKEAR
jgi:DNA-binding FrmR family transcriptional regulator